MKLNINKSAGIVQLSRNQKLSPGKVFLIGSESVSNCLYFKKAKDIKYAHKVINQKLTGILSVIDYLFTPKGWLLLVKFKSRLDITNFYNRFKSNKKKNIEFSAEQIISEVIRLTISSIAANVNKNSNRKGALVSTAFKRFLIMSISVVKKLIGKMKKQEIILSNQRKQFQPSLKYWNAKIKSKMGMCFLSSIQNEVNSISQENQIYVKNVTNEEIRSGLSYGKDVWIRSKLLVIRSKFDW